MFVALGFKQKRLFSLFGDYMAVDLQYVWCVDFPSSSGWYSDPGNFEHMYGTSTYTCNRGWVVLPAYIWQGAMQSGAILNSSSPSSPPSDFYADSTSLFYLFLAAVVAVYALKSIVLRLFHAS